MSDENTGLYNKFVNIERADGRHLPGQKHHGCRYFVLDLDHDQFAHAALLTYAHECREKYPQLTSDIIRWLAGEKTTGFGSR